VTYAAKAEVCTIEYVLFPVRGASRHVGKRLLESWTNTETSPWTGTRKLGRKGASHLRPLVAPPVELLSRVGLLYCSQELDAVN
jgi:hypothetical protein